MVTSFDSVEDLQQHGIGMQDITKLKAAGICTILSVAQTTRKNLLKIKVRKMRKRIESSSVIASMGTNLFFFFSIFAVR